MYIMKLTPAVKDYIWGGNKLKEEYSVKSDSERTAEAWVLSCHRDGLSVVENGEFASRTLSDVLSEHPEFLGTIGGEFERFPFLIKLIDAKDDLSVQVHPDDEYALASEGEPGKTELWYILECEEGASVVYGFTEELTMEQFRKAIGNGTLPDYLHRFEVKKGDVFSIEAGTIHAVGKGIVLAEIQQNSNTTYRVFDYDRTDADGNKRELHIEKAIDVTITAPPTIKPGASGAETKVDTRTETLLSSNEHFKTTLVCNKNISEFTVGEQSFASVVVLEGTIQLNASDSSVTLTKGESAFIPAGSGLIKMFGAADFLLTTV
ncbi:MAG: class I mannose-6-phosphate isomerase [Oscillospiraceae bacterium]|jgi:mannose-6-phosphate isomerase|nr:class I mannose-6-phosphate isomerase [Oscillospiraceae bacterium]